MTQTTTNKGDSPMNRKIVMLTLCVLFLSSSHLVFAQNGKNAQTMQEVYVTKSGKKYHKVDCPFIHDRKPEKISKKDALAKGLLPCPKCFKEDLPPQPKKSENK